jgi:CheY-like chemotaxis protein
MSDDGIQGVTALIVEDNPGDMKLTKKAFEKTPMPTETYTVKNGKEALDFLRRRGEYEDAPRPSLVLLDLDLPVKSGKEVLEEIGSDPALQTTLVVALTSSDDERDISDVYELGANAYLTKPVSFKGLVETVRRLEEFWYRIARIPDG